MLLVQDSKPRTLRAVNAPQRGEIQMIGMLVRDPYVVDLRPGYRRSRTEQCPSMIERSSAQPWIGKESRVSCADTETGVADEAQLHTTCLPPCAVASSIV